MAGDSPDLRIRLLGPLEVVSEGVALDLGGRRQRQILAILALNLNQIVSLDRMIDLLWGEGAPMRVEASIHSYISNLRRLLEPDRAARAPSKILPRRPPGYQLSLPGDRVDSWEFERMLGEARRVMEADPVAANQLLRQALDLWRGDALQDFVYEQFAVAEAERLEELRVEAVEARLTTDLATGRADGLVVELERLVETHPLRERLWYQLMLALYGSGRQAEALRTYQRFASILGEELGIEPSIELRRLEERILHQDPDLFPAPASGPPVALKGDTASPHMVGRERELEIFRLALDDARRETGRLILVGGEAGIGKTRLLEAMHSEARREGVPSLLARCVEVGGSPPYWPWSQTFRGLVSMFGPELVVESAGPYARLLAGALSALELEAEGRSTSLRTEESPHRLAEGIAHVLADLSASRPLAIFLDDLNSSDPDSLSVLVLLAVELEHLGTVVVASYRTDDLPSDHALSRTMAELARIDGVARLQLEPLDLEETTSVVEHIAGKPIPFEAAESIWARSEGNPFYAVELARLASEEDPVTSVRVEAAVPSTVRDVINHRLSRMGDSVIRFLTVASVAGRRWDLPLVLAVSRIELEDAIGLVEAAVGAGFIEEDDQPGRYRFTHVLVGEAIASGLGGLRQAQIHRQIADYLELEWGADPAWWADIAHHALEATSLSGPESAVGAVTRAGVHALELNAHESAEQLLTRGLDLVKTMPPGEARDRAEVMALLDLCRVWIRRGAGYHSPQITTAAARLLELGNNPVDGLVEDESTRVSGVVLPALHASFVQEMVQGRTDDAAKTVAMLDELAMADPDAKVAITAHIDTVLWAVHSGAVEEGLRRTDLALGLLAQLDPDESGLVTLPPGDQSMAVTAYVNGAWARALADRVTEATEMLERAKTIADRLTDPFSVGLVAAQGILVAHMVGDLSLLSDLIDWARRSLTPEFVLYDTWLTAGSMLTEAMSGDDRAPEELRQAIRRLETMGVCSGQTQWHGMLAEVCLAGGRIEEARVAALEGLEWASRHGERYWVPELERQYALALAAGGDQTGSVEVLDRAMAAAEEMGSLLLMRRLTAGDSLTRQHQSPA